jgi:integrase
MKLPNGYGTVYKLSGNRRKPWIARKTRAWTDEGKQQFDIIGYYATKADALQALAEYNDNPYDLEMSRVTFSEIYERWLKDSFDEEANRSSVKNYTTAYRHSKPLHNMLMADIRPHHMQQVLDSCNTHNAAKRVQLLYQRMYKWCIDHDAIKKNYADRLKVKQVNEPSKKNAFTGEKIKILWDNLEAQPYIGIILILIYSGVRISELLDLKLEDVHLEEQWFMVQASKTNAGIREVPIADKVLPIWKFFVKKSKCDYAITTIEGLKFGYENFRKRYWVPLLEKLNLKHTVHETRHTFISQLVMQNVNQTVIKTIVGHKSIMNLTEKIYTHIEMSELIKAVNLIP